MTKARFYDLQSFGDIYAHLKDEATESGQAAQFYLPIGIKITEEKQIHLLLSDPLSGNTLEVSAWNVKISLTPKAALNLHIHSLRLLFTLLATLEAITIYDAAGLFDREALNAEDIRTTAGKNFGISILDIATYATSILFNRTDSFEESERNNVNPFHLITTAEEHERRRQSDEKEAAIQAQKAYNQKLNEIIRSADKETISALLSSLKIESFKLGRLHPDGNIHYSDGTTEPALQSILNDLTRRG